MKKLILLRHGKTEDIQPDKTDFERQLTERGKKDIARVAESVLQSGVQADCIYCSSAARTRQTLGVFKAETGFELPEVYSDSLYHASADSILRQLEQAEESCDTIMLIGHNPGISELADALVKGNCPPLPTSGCVIIQFKDSIAPGQGVLEQIIFP